jgi:hypothetical protein
VKVDTSGSGSIRVDDTVARARSLLAFKCSDTDEYVEKTS